MRYWTENKSRADKDELASFAFRHIQKLCLRVAFVAAPENFERFIPRKNNNNEEIFIEKLSKLHLSSIYKDKVFEIYPESRVQQTQRRISTYDGMIRGKKCLLKLHEHSKEEVLGKEKLKSVSLRKEIEIARVLNAGKEPCPNIVQLLEASVELPMHMIIERASKGDLLTYLRTSNPFKAEHLLPMAMDVCNAMIYLGKQNIIHRDLRANNCLVFVHNGQLIIKLGDFRLAIPAYSNQQCPQNLGRERILSIARREDFHSQFSARWLAVEALQYREFSTASDVWSYGVLVFEIFTLGTQPYINMPNGLSLQSDQEVRSFVSTSYKLVVFFNFIWHLLPNRPSVQKTEFCFKQEPIVTWITIKQQKYLRIHSLAKQENRMIWALFISAYVIVDSFF